VVNLSSVVGKTITDIRLDADGTTQPGPWDIYYQDMVFIGADGTVRPLFSQNPVAPGMSGTGSTGMTQTAVTIHDCSGSGCSPTNTTTYFHDDHIGSARLLSEGYGYPVWQGTFTPFGQEVSAELTSNHYKFNGKERGEASEGGLDYFGARYYSSVLGRWMTPDWSTTSSSVPYARFTDPQSLNLYNYVTDDPLSRTDVDGHFQSAPANQSCGNNNGDSCSPAENFSSAMKNLLSIKYETGGGVEIGGSFAGVEVTAGVSVGTETKTYPFGDKPSEVTEKAESSLEAKVGPLKGEIKVPAYSIDSKTGAVGPGKPEAKIGGSGEIPVIGLTLKAPLGSPGTTVSGGGVSLVLNTSELKEATKTFLPAIGQGLSTLFGLNSGGGPKGNQGPLPNNPMPGLKPPTDPM
jgi:RHS repeat-associated protein